MDIPSISRTSQNEKISESFDIKQDNVKYILKIEINGNIILNILDEKENFREFETKYTLEELKQKHKIFSMLNSSKDFLDYIKILIQNKKLSIKAKSENQMIIELIDECLYKENIIQLDLSQKQINFNLITKDLYKKISTLNENYTILNEKYQKLMEENNKMNIILKEENKNIKEENKQIIEEYLRVKAEYKSLEEENKNIKNKIKILEEKIKFCK